MNITTDIRTMIVTMLAEGSPVWYVAGMVNMRSQLSFELPSKLRELRLMCTDLIRPDLAIWSDHLGT